jgi:hypothetical protein
VSAASAGHVASFQALNVIADIHGERAGLAEALGDEAATALHSTRESEYRAAAAIAKATGSPATIGG